MKIIFICGSIELGRDGVGDYVRCLSTELIRNNHSVSVIALNDSYVSSVTIEKQHVDGVDLSVLRIPKMLNNKSRIEEAGKWVATISPDWISVQFVPYSFHDKGLPYDFYKIIQELRGNAKLHILFHELWMSDVTTIKQRLIAFIQRKIIVRLVKKLNPQVIHTTIPYNQKRLFENNIKADTLELFGNIKKAADLILPGSISKIQYTNTNTNTNTNILYFGAPARGDFLNEMIQGLKELKNNSSVTLLIACGKAHHKDTFISTLTEKLPASNFTIIDCGFMEIHEISSLMSYASFGIGRAEGHLLGKSGTIIAMLEHGLPVWLPKLKNKTQLDDLTFRTDYIFADINNACNTNLPKQYEDRLAGISKQFINQLDRIQ